MTEEERTILEWQMGKAETAAWLARVEQRPDAELLIAQKIEACRARMEASPDKRPREEREADLMPQPTQRDIEIAQARAYAEQKALLAAAQELNLQNAITYLSAELAKMAPK